MPIRRRRQDTLRRALLTPRDIVRHMLRHAAVDSALLFSRLIGRRLSFITPPCHTCLAYMLPRQDEDGARRHAIQSLLCATDAASHAIRCRARRC